MPTISTQKVPPKKAGFIDALVRVLSDHLGGLSSKRVIMIVFSLLLVIGFFADLLLDLTVADNMIDALVYVVIAGVGISGAEKFAPGMREDNGNI